jgi:predicted Abi (CAAX) family protease
MELVMQYRVFDIDYDTDGETVELPQELTLELDDDADPSLELADAISDKTGWLVNGFQFEVVAPEAAPRA